MELIKQPFILTTPIIRSESRRLRENPICLSESSSFSESFELARKTIYVCNGL